MNHDPDSTRDRNERFWEQLAEVKRRHPGVEFDVSSADTGEPRYVYERDMLLVRDEPEHKQWVRGNATVAEELPANATGLVKFSVHLNAGESIPGMVRELNARRGRERPGDPAGSRIASPNQLVSITPVNMCPADEPHPVPPQTPPWPPPNDAGPGGEGVRILVIDTGLFVHSQINRPQVDGGIVELDRGIAGASRNPFHPLGPVELIKEYAGHGTFIAGVLQAAAPGATVWVSNLLQDGGAALEYDFGDQILTEIETFVATFGGWPHIISLSAGGTTHDNGPMASFKPFLDKLAEHRETILVAAAGNDGTSEHLFWPAAGAPDNDGIVSVGALRRTAHGRACFSNYGDWVSVFARGEGHVNLYPAGLYAYQHGASDTCRYYDPSLYRPCGCITDRRYGDTAAFEGKARWSGTSFATPLVAGMIASYMSKVQRFDRDTAWQMIRQQVQHGTDVDGVALRLLL
jgi:subtilisin family serine protease